MKKILIVFLLFLSMHFINKNIYAANTVNNFLFDCEKYNLVFSSKDPNTKGYINEYLRQQDNLTKWSKMISLYNYPALKDPISTASNFETYYKKTYPNSAIDVEKDKNKNEAYVAFIITDGKIIEFNYWRYLINKKYKGVICHLFYYRSKDNNMKKFDKEVGSNCQRWIKLFKAFDPPDLYQQDFNSSKK